MCHFPDNVVTSQHALTLLQKNPQRLYYDSVMQDTELFGRLQNFSSLIVMLYDTWRTTQL